MQIIDLEGDPRKKKDGKVGKPGREGKEVIRVSVNKRCFTVGTAGSSLSHRGSLRDSIQHFSALSRPRAQGAGTWSHQPPPGLGEVTVTLQHYWPTWHGGRENLSAKENLQRGSAQGWYALRG